MEEKININEIMYEVKKEVAKKMENSEYKKDIEQLKQISKSKLNNNIYDLYDLVYLKKRLIIPRSTRTGIVSKIMNVILKKFYFVILKILNPVLLTQERFNRKVFDELNKIQPKYNVENLDVFYQKFRKEFYPSEDEVSKSYNKVAKYIQNKDRMLDVGSAKSELLKFAKGKGVKEIHGVEPNSDLIGYADKEVFKISNKSVLEGLLDYEDNYFDIVTIFDTLEYYSLDYIMACLKEVRRILKDKSYVIIQTLDPENNELLEKNFNPIIKQIINKKLFRFILSYLNFENVQIINLDSEICKYVIMAQKTK